jgi:hypothetical protein
MPLIGVTRSAKTLWAKPMLTPGKKPAIDAQRSGKFWSSPARRSLLRVPRSLHAQICRRFRSPCLAYAAIDHQLLGLEISASVLDTFSGLSLRAKSA